MISSDRQLWDDADRYFRRSLEIIRAIGDVHLQGLCLLNHAEVHVARQRFEEARINAEAALAIFASSTSGSAPTCTMLGRFAFPTRS